MEQVKTVQGLNLKSPTTYIVIPGVLDSEEIRRILDLIKGFHPIFMVEYSFEEGSLTISSKLPSVWRESAKTLQELSSGKTKYDKAYDHIINTIIKQKLNSMSTIPIIYKAQELGYETTLTISDEGIIPGVSKGFSYTWNRYYTLGSGKGSQVTCSISSTKDSVFGMKTQRDKWSTNKLIQRLGLPIPRWDILESKADIERVWDEYKKPVVIKPTGLTGGNGVKVGIGDIQSAEKAFDYALKRINMKDRASWQRKIMIQEQVAGDANGADYRLLVIDGELSVCTKRIPAFVTGDGKSSIEELIIETNKDPRRDVTNPAHTLKPIVIDQPLKDLLKEKKLTLESVPNKDDRVYVRNIASMSRGGITEDFTDKVCPETKLIVESIAQSMHVFALGVDIICEDISKPITPDNGAILEVNTMPESYLNFFPVIGDVREDALTSFVTKLLEGNDTQQVVVIGNPKNDVPTTLRSKGGVKDGQVIGYYYQNSTKLDNFEINANIPAYKALESLKVNALLDCIVVHFRDWQEVEENGLGFDNINTIYVTKEIKSDKENFKVLKKYRRKGLIGKIKTL